MSVRAQQRRPWSALAAAALALLCLVAVAVPEAHAQTWRGELQGGGEIVVEPGSHRALREQNGRTRQLWDGVHRLEDGSTVTVRDGVAVPTQDMYRAWRRDAAPEPVHAQDWCKQLMRKTCGFDDACDNAGACLQARSLFAEAQRERRERRITRGPGADTDLAPTATAERCRAALSEAEFPACESLAQGGDSRCRELVLQVCGADNACADTRACDAARQLLDLETEERLALDDPGALSNTGQKCMEAMHNDFFTPCSP
ncbi:MAG: hypothetical protein GVY09_02610 [Gammaproteobacteria bacterium]|nr:hypothetical protein [Gammaproteobacteria bacterium]